MDDALADLQTRLTYQEDDLARLARELAEQQRELAQLKVQLARVQTQLRLLAPSQVGDAADEPPPPHY